MQAIADFNEVLEAKAPDTREGLYLSPPSDFEEARRDVLYLETIKQLLSPGLSGEKRLIIGDHRRLRAHLQNVPPDIGKVESVPALSALAYACHQLLGTTPWLQFTQPQKFDPTIRDGFAQVDAFPWDYGPPPDWEDDAGWFGDDEYDDLDDGALTPTVD